MYEGRNVAERLIGETNIEEIVNLIVGRKFTPARPARRPERRHRSDRVVTLPPARRIRFAIRPLAEGALPRQRQRRSHRAVLRRRASCSSRSSRRLFTPDNLLNILRQSRR